MGDFHPLAIRSKQHGMVTDDVAGTAAFWEKHFGFRRAFVVVAALVFFVPKFEDFFSKMPDLPLATELLLATSRVFTAHPVVASALVLGADQRQALATFAHEEARHFAANAHRGPHPPTPRSCCV